MLRLCSLFVFILTLPVAAQDISGLVRVIDGDTFDVGGQRVRLHGVDAPEADQVCVTQEGKDWLCGGWVMRVTYDRYEGRRARCTIVDTDRYGRAVARCRARGGDMGAWLVRNGMAFAYLRYSRDYVELEKEAALMDRGLHAVQVQNPAQHRQARVNGRTPTGDCKIKGNISTKGRIYHMPGQRHYDRTGIREAAGERWFCTEAEARAAGWRRARR